MKKLIISLVLTTILNACQVGENQMEMTFNLDRDQEILITIGLAGIGEASINWGDGTKPENALLSSYDEDEWINNKPNKYLYSHYYNRPSLYTITINGENVTFLNCNHNQLINIDISKNSRLIHLESRKNNLTKLNARKNKRLEILDVSDNLFTNSALNSLFRTLPDNRKIKLIVIDGNPGTATCNFLIATDKNWLNGALLPLFF